MKDYYAASDIASYDYYPYPYEGLSTIYNWNKRVMETVEHKKPLLCYLQTYNSPSNPLPTYQWLRSEVYLCVIQDMAMFFYYSWADPLPAMSLCRSMELQSQVKELSQELRILEKAILAQSEKNVQIDSLSLSGLYYGIKKVDGHAFLFVVNPEDKEKECEFTLPGCNADEVEVLFEGEKRLPIEGGLIKDHFERYETHIYKYR